jgi:hypothetical protein
MVFDNNLSAEELTLTHAIASRPGTKGCVALLSAQPACLSACLSICFHFIASWKQKKTKKTAFQRFTFSAGVGESVGAVAHFGLK